MWWFLGSLAAVQLYFVQELLAAFALFAAGFGVLAVVVLSAYLLQKGWASAMVRMAHRAMPVFAAALRGIGLVEDLAKRPFRRPGSEPAR